MEEELQIVFDLCEEEMQKSIHHLEIELGKIRAGKASPAVVSGINVDYYGTDTPLNQVANINTPDARTISIQPWEKSMLGPIEKAIYAANIGLTPQGNGEMIMLNIPPMTEERRVDLVRQIKHIAEESRIGLRAARKHANDEIKTLHKDGLSDDNAKDAESKIQDIVNAYSKKIDNHIDRKEQEIMTV